MPIPLPNLDDRTWEDLVKEGRSLIPVFAPEWTDHNVSDPGITLMELFAAMTEGLIYRTNRITKRHLEVYAKLLGRLPADNSDDRREVIAAQLRELTQLKRAVTSEDYEILAGRVEGVARAYCMPNRKLDRSAGGTALTEAAGQVLILVVPQAGTQTGSDLKVRVAEALESARLLATQVRVDEPDWLEISLRAALTLRPGYSPEPALRRAEQALRDFFDPLRGGADGTGWPLGKSVFVSEIYAVLQRLPEVLSVHSTASSPLATPAVTGGVTGLEQRIRRNDFGELEAIEFRPFELPAPQIELEVR